MAKVKQTVNINNYNKATKEVIEEVAEKSAKNWTDFFARGIDGDLPIPTKGLAAAISIIGVASVADLVMDKQDEKRAEKQERRQEEALKKKINDSLGDRSMGMGMLPTHTGLVQEMFNNRIGHSNSWGGVRY